MPRSQSDSANKNNGDVLYSISHQFTLRTRPIVYLLDRNIVSLIRSVNAGKVPADDNQRRMFEWLRTSDKKENFFSPMTSLAEGNQKGIMSGEQFRAVILSESASIGTFFKHARTDNQFFDQMVDTFCSFPIGLNETPYADYIRFLKTVSPLIVDTVSVRRRESVRDSIINEAIARGIVPSHPVVMCCLSILYGSDVSRRVLKPSEALKKDEWHNAFSDIQIVSRLGQFASIGPDVDFVFMTMDKALREFVDFFTVTGARSSTDNPASRNAMIEIATNIKFDIFPELSEQQILELGQLLVDAGKRLPNRDDEM
jgi:hypothetical protein